MANFSLATTERWRDRNTGEKREKTEWHRISVFGDGLVGITEKYVRKGSKLFIRGEIRTRKWQDQNGQDRYSTEIVLRGPHAIIKLLDPPQQNNNQQQGGHDRSYQAPPPNQQQNNPPPSDGGGDMDDDIPF